MKTFGYRSLFGVLFVALVSSSFAVAGVPVVTPEVEVLCQDAWGGSVEVTQYEGVNEVSVLVRGRLAPQGLNLQAVGRLDHWGRGTLTMPVASARLKLYYAIDRRFYGQLAMDGRIVGSFGCTLL